MNKTSLKPFLSFNGKKLLISNNVGEISDVLKNYVVSSKTPIFDIEQSTVIELAKAIFISLGKSEKIQLLSADESNILFYTFLSSIHDSMIYGLIPQESMAMSTSKMVYQTICEVRLGKKVKSTKLDKLISDFQAFLVKNNCFDEPLLLEEANKLLKDKSSDEIKNALGFGDKVNIGVFVSLNEKLRYLEAELLNSLEKLYGNELNLIDFRNEKVCPNIVKTTAYGYYNEVRFVLDQIEEKKLRLSDVSIYVTDNKYDNLIKALFENVGVPYKFSSGSNGETDDYISLFKSILEFLYDHLNINSLYQIYRNGALKDEYKNIAQLRNLRSNDHAISEKVKRSKDYEWNESQKLFIEDLIEHFDMDAKISKIYHSLIVFINKYTSEESQIPGNQLLVSKERFISFMDKHDLSFEEKIKFIMDVIKDLKVSKEKSSNDGYVEISSLSGATFLNRKHNFVIGLSAKQFEVKEIESPLFSDSEFLESLDNSYYIEVSKGKNAKLIEQVNNLFKTLDNGSIYLVRSDYDSSELKELAPSILMNMDVPKVESINHYKDEIAHTESKGVLKEMIIDLDYAKELLESKSLSPSALEKLINCPLNYIYSTKYDDVELDEYTGAWLKQGDAGTFAHMVLEEYFKMPSSSSTYDEKYLLECFKLAKESTIAAIPFDSKNKQDTESETVLYWVKKYLERYYSSRKADEPYQTIAREARFKDVSIEGYEFHGIIDRIDAYVDFNKVLHMRIIDYKTTSYKSFDNKVKGKTVTQCVIYSLGAVKWIEENRNNPEVKSIGNFDSIDIEGIEFIYELIKTHRCKDYPNKESREAQETAIVEALTKYQELLKDPSVNKFIQLYTPEMGKGGNFDEGHCDYCPFKTMCHLKLRYGENLIWKK